MKEIVRLRNVTKDYGKKGEVVVHALRGIDLTLRAGDFAAVAGPSGSGKSTLLNIIGGLDKPTAGSVEVDGREITALSPGELSRLRRDRIGFIFQNYNLIPVLTALENAEYVLMLQGIPLKERRARVRELLKKVGLEGMENRFPRELADEPTANVDSRTAKSLLDLMRALNEEKGVTFLFSTHDREVMKRAGRLLVLKDGMITRNGLPGDTDE